MARRKKGREISGWLIVDKPAGITSTAVVGKVRWAFEAKKAGHAGTLDPEATGVLAVALGEATKTVPYITDALKCYRFEVRWGAQTNTDDAEGEVTQSSATRPDAEAIAAALPAFRGEISQVPPAFSAVKIDGERAYTRARNGEAFEIAARPLWVGDLTLIEAGSDTAILEMTCGKGGYVRAIARDLGIALGCLGHVGWLRRVWSGPFDAGNGVVMETIERLARTPEIDALLLPIEAGLHDLPEVTCDAAAAARLGHGNAAMVRTAGLDYGAECWVSCDGAAIAVGQIFGAEVKPSRVFVQPE